MAAWLTHGALWPRDASETERGQMVMATRYSPTSTIMLPLLLLACGSDGPDGSSCSAAVDNCLAESICVAGDCVDAFPRVYSARILEVNFPPRNPENGDCWDLECGAPDPFVSDPGEW